MIEIRATCNEVDLTGSSDELQGIRMAILHLINSAETLLVVPAQASANPRPYDFALSAIHIERGTGATRVKIQDQKLLLVSGADDNLARFSSWFTVAPGGHSHYEYFEGNLYVAEDSIPLVVGAKQ